MNNLIRINEDDMPASLHDSKFQSTQRSSSFGKTLMLSVLVATLSGCSMIGKHVNAYERSTLSKQGMLLVENPQEQASMNHMFNAREGSVGGMGGAGGGCGCN